MTDTEKAISHTGQDVGDSNVSLTGNLPNTDSPIATWTVPDNYDSITYNGSEHNIYARLRSKETFTGTTGDDTAYSTDADLVAPGGEIRGSEMPYDPVKVYNVTQGKEIIVNGYDFQRDEVLLGSDPADGDEVAVFPVVSSGSYKMEARDLFDNRAGTGTRFGQTLRNFVETKQTKDGQKVRYPAEVTVETGESIAVNVDCPHQVVWSDPDYVWDDTASKLELDVTVSH